VGSGDENISVGLLPIKVLERHQYTTQTFTPLALSPLSSSPSPSTVYIVVVAPTFPSGPDAGMPDVVNAKAFLASGGQAVTYGVGVWHAPMIVVGPESVGFVVVQVTNGVGEDDCEEVGLMGEGNEGDAGVVVVVPELGGLVGDGKGMKSRL